MIEIPPGLREAIKADELVLFVGAGLSWNFKNKKNETLEGWTKMASSITSYLKEKHRITEDVKQSCDKKEPIDALKEIEDSGVNKGIVGEFVKDYFSLGEGNDYSLQQKLFELSTKIITTNYDTALEKAVPQLQEIKAYRGKDYELNRLKKDPIFLFKLHGCIEHIDSMVLFPSDYGKLYNSNRREAEHTLSALRNLIFNKTFLFIGTGLGDPQISSFFKEIKRIQGIYSQEHYIITSDPLEKSLDFLTRIPIPSYEEIPGIIDQLLEIKRAEDEKNTPLKEQLKEIEKRNEVLAKELEEVKDEHKKNLLLLEWESNNRFNRGLRYHLAGEYLDASEEYKVATILNPKNYEAFCNWGATLMEMAKTKSGGEAEALYKEAIEKYQEAIKDKPHYYVAYYNWGVTLMDLAAGIKSDSEAEDLYKEAIEKYQEAIKNKPDYYTAYYNWGVALMELAARTESDSEAQECYKEAFDKFRNAVEYKPDFYMAYCNWGLALKELAERAKSDSEAEERYKDAFDKFQNAVKYKPDSYEAYYNWGTALSGLAYKKFGSEKEKHYYEAIDKYQEAVKYKSDYHASYYNWGVTLEFLAESKSGDEKEILINEAIEKYLQAIKYGGRSYKLARLYALRNRKEDALKYLDLALSRGEVSVEFVENGWNGMRDDPDFKRLLSRHKGK
ncbi:tetratricopeptide repeat protein [Porphyromonas endodontalis]|uniref:tetratricopeptide repeat protein n=1 Tax=Porphyromonas endodontalis TaxID=28124 RepID=UPI003C7B5D4E